MTGEPTPGERPQGPNAIQLSAESEISQIYDWGKGKRALSGGMEKVEQFARRLGG